MILLEKCDFLYSDPLDIRVKLETLAGVDFNTEMSEFDHAFLCGLIRKNAPKKILEVGVSAGGTSCVIINCLEKLHSQAEFHSVELSEQYYRNPDLKSGHLVSELFPDWRKRWHFHVGHTVGAYLDAIGSGIDLCILDSAHILPGELLDFLAKVFRINQKLFPALRPLSKLRKIRSIVRNLLPYGFVCWYVRKKSGRA